MKLVKSHAMTAFFIAAAFTPAAFGVPVKFPDCARQTQIKHVSGSNGAYLNENCTVLYVLPPTRGNLTVNGYVPSPNLQTQCGRLEKIETEWDDLQKISSVTTQRLLRYTEELKELEETMASGLLPVGETKESLEDKIVALSDKMDALRLKLVTWENQNNDKKLRFAQVEGGRGKFFIESTHPALIAAYQQANPRLKVVGMPIDQGFISMNESKAEASDAAAMPAVLKLRAVGLEEIPLLLDPAILLAHKELAPRKAPAGSKLFNGALSGELQVSNIGACALQKIIGSTPTFSAGDVKSYISTTGTFGYQIQVTRKHSLTYNFKELISQLHEATKRGGFFNSSTVNTFIDDRSSSTWIQFHVSSQDARFEYTDAYVREVKKEMIDRALAQIISLKTGSPTALLALLDPGKNGADAIGDELGKCPNAYCQMGAGAAKVLSAIFGSSSATANLVKQVSGELTETVTEKRMVPAYGTYIFE